MFTSPVRVSLLAIPFLFAAANPANAILGNARAANKTHTDSLHMAASELKHAHSDLSGKGGNAHHHLKEAIRHIETAIHHHKTTQLNQSRTGLSGTLLTAAHHHHHSQLHEALHAAKEAEKHLASGNVHAAKHEAEKAHHHVELAMSHHKTLNIK